MAIACTVGVVACSGGGGGDGGGGVVNPPNNPPPPPSGDPVPSLEDASDRLLAGLSSTCLASVTAALTSLRGKMSPSRTATAADVNAVRSALATCPDDATAADRDALRLALDVADDVVAGR